MLVDLQTLYSKHSGKISDKWSSNLAAYENIFSEMREKPIRILEIGVQNGGSLEIWAKYFKNATAIVGCDINEKCHDLLFEDDRISVIIGDATTNSVKGQVTDLCSEFDIIIDDGSHMSGDIIRTFSLYFPILAKDGIFIVEDLYCSYWEQFNGGIEYPSSSLSFFRRLTDYLNREHWGVEVPVKEMLTHFIERWNIIIDPDSLKQITQVRFFNSMALVYKGDIQEAELGKRVVAGDIAKVVDDVKNTKVTLSEPLCQDHNPFGPTALRREDFPKKLNDISKAYEIQLRSAEEKINFLHNRIATTRRNPLRSLKELIEYALLSNLVKSRFIAATKAGKRFARSARKRDPKRSDFESCFSDESSKIDYKKIVAEWRLQRKSLQNRKKEILIKIGNGLKISIVVPVFNPELKHLSKMIKSVQNQSYSNWELCISDDCSEHSVRSLLQDIAKNDDRIKLILRTENGHISKATNSAIEICTGDFIAFLDHDDLLDEDALFEVARVVNKNRSVGLVYTDEDIVSDDDEPIAPHFKPDWNRDLLYSHNYITHFVTIDAKLLKKVGGLRSDFDGAQDYDLLLRASEHLSDNEIFHIPKVLYHWRASANSTASSGAVKPYAHSAGQRALAEHLQRTLDTPARVLSGELQFTYKVVWPMEHEPLVSIIIPTRDRLELIRVAVESVLRNTDYTHFEILIVDNGSVEGETLRWFDEIQVKDKRVRVLAETGPFNFSRINNRAVNESKGEMIVLLNNDIEVINNDWLREMVALGLREGTGCVGAKLYYPSGHIQHAGVIIGLGGSAGHGHLMFSKEDHGYYGRLKVRQNYSAVTAACLLVKKNIFIEVGGLNEEELSVAFNDIDFSLKVQKAGYKNVWTPFAELIHYESANRGYEDTQEKKERFKLETEFLQKTWNIKVFCDPAYNPNLTLDHSDFSFGPAKWSL